MADAFVAERKSVLAGAHGGSPSVRLRPAEAATRVSLRARPEDVAALSKALGLNLPVKPKGTTAAKGRLAFWLGPDEWLLIDDKGGDLMADCAASGALHSATDVSHRNAAIVVSGPVAANAINAGCPLNLSLRTFPVGAVARTVFGKIEAVIYRVDEETFRLECWRSFAEYAFGLLNEAAEDAAA
ncbi:MULTISPECIES: sarcosine oxidase subunit gamma [Alphaproteobacteria]|uniref:Sarcosine oxidase subunit gamma n=2 Tax=Alphaproteobacteria TaxID=28211 RepID=A0A512HKQ7_9HYPH|nr:MULTISPECIES: sarcosine oxidase subunit gamma [Alphaproteobacteria]GEO86032.1 sarcosine oxidase subunit gamma [Ciceribacter naphthalenivorans]GLR22119.1 sarcosine oxidase subunit gamma [Ciceribacter naphthalenivorans]GLT04975.1 sarcosine oxidase subunit gamma [Sphingomonas psychrolutea]